MFSSTKTSRFNASSFQIIKDAMLQSDAQPLCEVVDDDQWQAAFDRHDIDFGRGEFGSGVRGPAGDILVIPLYPAAHPS